MLVSLTKLMQQSDLVWQEASVKHLQHRKHARIGLGIRVGKAYSAVQCGHHQC